MNLSLVLACASATLLAACAGAPAKVDENVYRRELEEWRGERLKEITGEDGWLTLAGLYWLREGENRVGSDASNEIVLRRGDAPGYVGSLWLERGAVRFESAGGAGVTNRGEPVARLDLKSDAGGAPIVLNLGSLSFQVIERGGRMGLRVRDREHPARREFRGLEYYPPSLGWRIEATFVPYNPPKSIPIVNVLGMSEDHPSPGALVFEAGGGSHRLDTIPEGAGKLFIIFADETSGKETYGGGRYLYASPADAEGIVVLDFNKAHSPPCAFTDYATCPLPPPQNRLALKVEAGEKHVK